MIDFKTHKGMIIKFGDISVVKSTLLRYDRINVCHVEHVFRETSQKNINI